MIIDPLSWAVGFALDATASRFVDKAMAFTLASELKREAAEWAKGLPPTRWLYVPTLFQRSNENETSSPMVARGTLQETLACERIPSHQVWLDALIEQWRMIRARSDTDRQPFYDCDEEIVLPHLAELARRLHSVCQRHDTLFRTHAAQMLEDILARVSADKGIPITPLRAILRRLGDEDVPVERILERLEARADEYRQLVERMANTPNAATLALLQQGDLEAARRSLQPTDILRTKRNGEALSREGFHQFIHGVASGEWPDYQTSALLMAIVLRGMTTEETAWLTEALAQSGERLDLSDIPGPRITLHTTGAVGDKTPLLAPAIAAACGLVVPVVSSRGLSYFGGTLDKLEAIPRLRISLSSLELKDVLRAAGSSIISPSSSLVPADRKLHALRDVTGSVESIPLIAASMLGKAIATGSDAAVFGIGYGAGSLFRKRETAEALATELATVGQMLGFPTHVDLLPTDQPTGRAIGNSLELIECVEVFRGGGPADVRAQALSIAARMLQVCGKGWTIEDSLPIATAALDTGTAFEAFRRMVAGQGGDITSLDDHARLPQSSKQCMALATTSGRISSIDGQQLGLGALILGSGRQRVADAIDPGVGLRLRLLVGDRVKVGTPLADVYYNSSRQLDVAMSYIEAAFIIRPDPLS
jgi:pyrimidine-nucleoside phosphorylase